MRLGQISVLLVASVQFPFLLRANRPDVFVLETEMPYHKSPDGIESCTWKHVYICITHLDLGLAIAVFVMKS